MSRNNHTNFSRRLSFGAGVLSALAAVWLVSNLTRKNRLKLLYSDDGMEIEMLHAVNSRGFWNSVPPDDQINAIDLVDEQFDPIGAEKLMFQDGESDQAIMRKIYARKFDYRRMLMNRSDALLVQLLAIPQVICPSAVRLGSLGDGGKCVCTPWILRKKKNCLIYSLGVDRDVTFERDLNLVINGACEIYLFDLVPQEEKIFAPFKGIFRQWQIGNVVDVSKNQHTIKSIMTHFGHEARKIDILKIDVELAEFPILQSMIRDKILSGKFVCQILIEVHSKQTKKWRWLFEVLENRGFYLFFQEGNPLCSFCREMSYIHESCFKEFKITNDEPYLRFLSR